MNLAPLIGFTIGAALLAGVTVLAFLWAPSDPGPSDEDRREQLRQMARDGQKLNTDAKVRR